VTLNSEGFSLLGGETSLSGGTLTAPRGISLGNGSTLWGSGTVSAKVAGGIGSTIMPVGNMTLGNSLMYDGFATAGYLNVSGYTVTLNSRAFANLGSLTAIDGGTLVAPNGISLGNGSTLGGIGTVNAKVAGGIGSTIAAFGNLTLGDMGWYDGFTTAGNLNVGSYIVTLRSKGFANLGGVTAIDGGTLAANGISLGNGSTLYGSGAVNSKIAAALGSMVAALGGNLTLGDVSSPAGFASDGELYTDVSVVTLYDSNQAVLGSLTQLGYAGVGGGSGALIALNGLVVDFGRNLVGEGEVISTNTLAKAVIINGAVAGTGTGLNFNGYVKGVGTYSGPVIFSGTYSPGLSPASVNLENMTLRPTSTLIIELGGRSPGTEYDVVNLSGAGSLDGTLNVTMFNEFRPDHNDQFTVMKFDSRAGDFATKTGLDLGGRLQLMPQYTANSLVLTAVQGGSGAWKADRNGGASVPANWNNGLPNGVGDMATFGPVITQPRTITIDQPIVWGGMVFTSDKKYTLSGSSSQMIQLDTGGGAAMISVTAGSAGSIAAQISAPMNLLKDLTITNASLGELLIDGGLDNSLGKAITVSGRLTLDGPQNHGPGALFTILGSEAGEAPSVLNLDSNGGDNLKILNKGVLNIHADNSLQEIIGTGVTVVESGTELNISQIVQNTLTIGAGAKLTITPITTGQISGMDSLKAVPEPGMIVMLITGAIAVLLVRRARRWKVGHAVD
jgi:hypothetical protein